MIRALARRDGAYVADLTILYANRPRRAAPSDTDTDTHMDKILNAIQTTKAVRHLNTIRLSIDSSDRTVSKDTVVNVTFPSTLSRVICQNFTTFPPISFTPANPQKPPAPIIGNHIAVSIGLFARVYSETIADRCGLVGKGMTAGPSLCMTNMRAIGAAQSHLAWLYEIIYPEELVRNTAPDPAAAAPATAPSRRKRSDPDAVAAENAVNITPKRQHLSAFAANRYRKARETVASFATTAKLALRRFSQRTGEFVYKHRYKIAAVVAVAASAYIASTFDSDSVTTAMDTTFDTVVNATETVSNAVANAIDPQSLVDTCQTIQDQLMMPMCSDIDIAAGVATLSFGAHIGIFTATAATTAVAVRCLTLDEQHIVIRRTAGVILGAMSMPVITGVTTMVGGPLLVAALSSCSLANGISMACLRVYASQLPGAPNTRPRDLIQIARLSAAAVGADSVAQGVLAITAAVERVYSYVEKALTDGRFNVYELLIMLLESGIIANLSFAVQEIITLANAAASEATRLSGETTFTMAVAKFMTDCTGDQLLSYRNRPTNSSITDLVPAVDGAAAAVGDQAAYTATTLNAAMTAAAAGTLDFTTVDIWSYSPADLQRLISSAASPTYVTAMIAVFGIGSIMGVVYYSPYSTRSQNERNRRFAF